MHFLHKTCGYIENIPEYTFPDFTLQYYTDPILFPLRNYPNLVQDFGGGRWGGG
jgi:hypothetical protein